MIKAVHCTYDPDTKGGNAPDGRKVKGTIHWVSAKQALYCTVNLYDRLFNVEHPDADKDVDFKEHINPDSRIRKENCVVEPSLADAVPGSQLQFERQGYFNVDIRLSQPGKPVFNRIVTLRDSWARMGKNK